MDEYLAKKKTTQRECDKTISETENAYMKIQSEFMKQSEDLLQDVLKREASELEDEINTERSSKRPNFGKAPTRYI